MDFLVDDHAVVGCEVQLRTCELSMFLIVLADSTGKDLELVHIRLILVPQKTEKEVVHVRFPQDTDELIVRQRVYSRVFQRFCLVNWLLSRQKLKS